VLGGSFNPAHAGHVHLSAHAKRLLGLDSVWWLVSPQNPLKPVKGMAPFADRLAGARHIAPRFVTVSDIEARLGTRYTVDTLAALKRAFPAVDFVWLMGADNLLQLPRWRDWPRLFALVPIAVFDRDAYLFPALASVAAKRFARFRRGPNEARRLAHMRPPAWTIFRTPLHPASATELRQKRGGPK
jgi:nicotinate-nucleotide adenylyltransferase